MTMKYITDEEAQDSKMTYNLHWATGELAACKATGESERLTDVIAQVRCPVCVELIHAARSKDKLTSQ